MKRRILLACRIVEQLLRREPSRNWLPFDYWTPQYLRDLAGKREAYLWLWWTLDRGLNKNVNSSGKSTLKGESASYGIVESRGSVRFHVSIMLLPCWTRKGKAHSQTPEFRGLGGSSGKRVIHQVISFIWDLYTLFENIPVSIIQHTIWNVSDFCSCVTHLGAGLSFRLRNSFESVTVLELNSPHSLAKI